jgi:hypothetical protein
VFHIRISLTIASSSEEVTAIVVEMVAFDCILGLPWLQDVNLVVGWEQKTLLLPTDHGPVEVDMSSDSCRPGVPTPTLRTVAQLQEVAKERVPVFLVTLKETGGTRGPASPSIEEKLSPEWGMLISAFDDVFRNSTQGCPRPSCPA